jgi:hypothetical protein
MTLVTKDMPKITLESIRADADVMVRLAEILEPYDRDAQMRILEAACVLLNNDEQAAMFRGARLGRRR